LIGGDGEVISAIYNKRTSVREANGRYPSKDIFGWSTAYGPMDSPATKPTPAGKIPGAKS
jgi:formate dehydrogenase iron-sulfur subunit